jgi:N-acyl-phosphatidylethanolamine-hydrolysing phospholipase D
MNGMTILTDPMFSLRASPSQCLPIGVPRELPPSHSLSELLQGQGTIDVCCITHDHYDHLDRDSVDQLKPHVKLWVVPLGLADWLVEKCQIDRKSIAELEWWQQVHVEKDNETLQVVEQLDTTALSSLTITCCPASHWASRTMTDRNTRLWCSFALASAQHRLFFCGDTGYPTFPLFRQIGDALGPFDLAAIPIGAYEPSEMMREAHVNPWEAVQVHKDLRSQRSVAIHWGSFELSEEDLQDPPKDLERAMAEEDLNVVPSFDTLVHGGNIEVSAARNYDEEEYAYEAAVSSGMSK